jgi:acetylornithine deacetylase/succinyl-diaminopimelate desuccinylase-like protein
VPELSTIHERPVELLQSLLRFDTTNPPGNEGACIGYVRDVLAAYGIESTILAKDPNRPNLVARLAGQGTAAPLLLQGHVDVVTTVGQEWQRPPFAGEVADGFIWGRGAIDMKGGVAMMLAAFLRARAQSWSLPGDVVLAVMPDEETGSPLGAAFLVDEHAELFGGIRYAIGELGGFSFELGGRRFYLIQVAEKVGAPVRLIVRGPGGHGSMPMRGGAMARLGTVLRRLEERRPPIHVTPVTRQMVETMAAAVSEPLRSTLQATLDPKRADDAFPMLGALSRVLEPSLRHMVNPTVVRGGEKSNVIPSEITLDLDVRLLPGFGTEDVVPELRAIVGAEVEIEPRRQVARSQAGEPDLTLFPLLTEIIREQDPEGVPVPFMMSGGTDGRFFARLGIQPYGYLPMKLPPGFDFLKTVHAADERITVEAIELGTNAIGEVLQRFGEVG